MKTINSSARSPVIAWLLTAKTGLLVALLLSCTRQPVPIPSQVIPPDSMTAILTDVHLIEGARIGSRVMGDSLSVGDYYQKLYAKHGITRARFDSSFDFYSQNPEHMAPIYEKVVENLNRADVRPAREKLEEQPGPSGLMPVVRDTSHTP